MVRRLAFVIALASGSAACAAVLGFERLSEDGRVEDGGADGRVEDGDAGPDAPFDPICSSVGVPDPPDGGGGEAGAPLLIALSRLDFGIDTTQIATGFNLDRACTSDVATGTCTTTAPATTFAKYVIDRTNGVDNAGYALLQDVSRVNGETFGPAAINERLRGGQFGVVLRVTEWDGSDDDGDVRVEVFPTLSVVNADLGATPSFDAGDVWTRDERFRLASDASKFISVRGWVRNRALSAFFTEATLSITIPDDDKRFDIVLREAWFTGRLEDGRIVDGIAAGRWRTQDFLGEVRMIRTEEYRLCESPTRELLYAPVKKTLCEARDIHAFSVDDGKPTSCEAISVGIRFDSYPVTALGDFSAEAPYTPRCEEDAGIVPLGDDCP